MYIGSFKPTSNRETWSEVITLTDSVSGELIDISNCVINMAVTDGDRNCSVLTASIGSGIELIEETSFQFKFLRSQMCALEPKSYDVGITIALEGDEDGTTSQLFAGSVPVYRGVVS